MVCTNTSLGPTLDLSTNAMIGDTASSIPGEWTCQMWNGLRAKKPLIIHGMELHTQAWAGYSNTQRTQGCYAPGSPSSRPELFASTASLRSRLPSTIPETIACTAQDTTSTYQSGIPRCCSCGHSVPWLYHHAVVAVPRPSTGPMSDPNRRPDARILPMAR